MPLTLFAVPEGIVYCFTVKEDELLRMPAHPAHRHRKNKLDYSRKGKTIDIGIHTAERVITVVCAPRVFNQSADRINDVIGNVTVDLCGVNVNRVILAVKHNLFRHWGFKAGYKVAVSL